MSTKAASDLRLSSPRRSPLWPFVAIWAFARKKPLGAIGLSIVVVATFVAVFGEQLAPHDPAQPRLDRVMQAPNNTNWFGTDHLGRDMFSRTLVGTRVSLYVGVVTMLFATFAGTVLGISSAYIGGRYDLIVQRFVDGIVAVPQLLLAMTLVAALNVGMENVIIALAIVTTPRIARIVRSAALGIMAMPYIDASRAMGTTGIRIMARHLAPNTFAPLLVVASASVGAIITSESSLSFLGLGVPFKTISWGGLLGGETRALFTAAPWMAIGPGVALSMVVFGNAIFADALRDMLDPKLRGRR